MTNKLFNDELIVLSTFRTDRKAEMRGLARLIAVTIVAATAFAATTLTGTGRSEAMQLDAAPAIEGSYMVAYAEPLPERFGGMMDGVYSAEEEEHELNDAWMGMTVVSKDGVELGYVSDALISEDGMSDELVITPTADSPLNGDVALPLIYAELDNDDVALSLTAGQAIATLIPVEDFARFDELELAYTEN